MTADKKKERKPIKTRIVGSGSNMKPGLDNLLKSFLSRKSLKIYFKDRGNLKPMLQFGLIFD